MEKPIKDAVSVIIRNTQGETLFALRSPHKNTFPLMWSLPSHTVIAGESPDATIARIGSHKLGVELQLVRLLNEGYGERPNYRLFMHDYEAQIIAGEPRLASDDYIELKWAPAETFLPTLKTKGDCTRLYDEYLTLR